MVRVVSVVWRSDIPLLRRACEELGIELIVWSRDDLKDCEKREKCLKSFDIADIVILHPSRDEWNEWSEIESALKRRCDVNVISLGYDASLWSLSNAPPDVVAKANAYFAYGGYKNVLNMLKFILNTLIGIAISYEPPEEYPWQGIYHPDADRVFQNVNEYLMWYEANRERNEDSRENGVHHASHQQTHHKSHPNQSRQEQRSRLRVGILFYRTYWLNGDLEVVDALIREFERQGIDVIPAFSTGMGDRETGAKTSGDVINDFFVGNVDALVNLQPIFAAKSSDDAVNVLKKIDVPVFHPVLLYYKTEEEWREDSHGLSAAEVGWSVAMPEFEGLIEPLVVGAKADSAATSVQTAVSSQSSERSSERSSACAVTESSSFSEGTSGISASSLKAQAVMKQSEDEGRHVPIEERVQKIVRRVKRWILLRRKPKSARKVAFILHNKPCASVEATVGSASHLDALESVSRILKRMRDEGYAIENPPEDGKALIDEIMRRKAISEFRWTTVDEIVKKGGALTLMSSDEYERWFRSLDDEVQRKVCDVWGEPPGEAMVYDGKIVITGVSFGNAIVCVQPKRGCAGARCDGHVCKILHDPDTPPTHQYLATYHYIADIFGADVIVHVGTHGNLEFLPGKSVGLSSRCFPDIAIGDVPHLYIYNSDNPPEGTIAKRRSYATLVDHLQAVLTESNLYGDLKTLDELIAEYRKLRATTDRNTVKADSLRRQISELILKTKLSATDDENEERSEFRDRHHHNKINEMNDEEFDSYLDAVHEKLSLIYDTQIPDGMHVFGEIPQGARKEDFIYAILREKFRNAVRELLHHIRNRAEFTPGISFVDRVARDILHRFIECSGGGGDERGCETMEIVKDAVVAALRDVDNRDEKQWKDVEKDLAALTASADTEFSEFSAFPAFSAFSALRSEVAEISARLDATDEMGALMHGFDAGYIEPGASGLITRGKIEILPTGRNFYSLDPFKIPTKAAWEVGKKLADALLRKYMEEKGEFPENVAMYWMASDIMWADGEQLSQIFYLIGVEPVWDENGRVVDFRIIPLETLKRPRIDVTVRVSGIIRDCFYNCIELLDRAFRAVSSLDEPPSMNFLRKHAVENEAKGCEDAYARIFSSKPGTYGSGVNLAVYASAWNSHKDLADVFIYWNCYAYGENKYGINAHRTLVSQLKTVSATFNKTSTDEYDLFGCCCYFSTHGGLTVAARELSGKDVIALYGDTRNGKAEVRTLAEEINRVVRAKILNPKWIDGMKRHGYSGASEISKRIGRIYGWEASTEEVSDWIFDEIARTFVLDDEMRAFFERENPWALEEIGRRLIEAYERGLWKASDDVLEGLRAALLEIEGWMEEKMGIIEGEFQGSSINVVTKDHVESWKKKYEEVIRG